MDTVLLLLPLAHFLLRPIGQHGSIFHEHMSEAPIESPYHVYQHLMAENRLENLNL